VALSTLTWAAGFSSSAWHAPVREDQAGIGASSSFRKGERAFFVYGFAKSDRENIDPHEAAAFKKSAKAFFALSDKQIEILIKDKELSEVDYED